MQRGSGLRVRDPQELKSHAEAAKGAEPLQLEIPARRPLRSLRTLRELSQPKESHAEAAKGAEPLRLEIPARRPLRP